MHESPLVSERVSLDERGYSGPWPRPMNGLIGMMDQVRQHSIFPSGTADYCCHCAALLPAAARHQSLLLFFFGAGRRMLPRRPAPGIARCGPTDAELDEKILKLDESPGVIDKRPRRQPASSWHTADTEQQPWLLIPCSP